MGVSPDLARALLDLSLTGARLLLKEPLEPRQALVLELYHVAHPKEVRVESRVARWAATPEGAYLIGVRFERNLPYAELQRLTGGHGRRLTLQAPRRAGSPGTARPASRGA
jgi:hypothetical protein